jgi:non-ribosomal peptide synthetase component F
MNNFFDIFIKTMKKNSEKVAVSCGTETITYKELYDKSLSFGNELLTGKTDRIIPVFKEAGIEWFTEVLGIFYAGKTAVPISKAVPPERVKFILDDIKKPENLSADAALIYYTSGSTGTPKGVILTHTGLASLADATDCILGDEKIKNIGVSSDTSFDAFILLTLPALYRGNTIFIAPENARASLVNIHKFYIKNKIDAGFLTTQLAVSYMRIFKKSPLKILLTGGEALRNYYATEYDVWNLYGPCEATVYVTVHKLTEEDEKNPFDIPIGKATGKNRILIIDGELCISGPQLAAGYLNRQNETEKKFVQNPEYLSEKDDHTYKIIYKTGDKAELNANGEFLYRGRKDKQIKISGYRIEPDEIEAKIMACSGITAVIVQALKNENGEAILTAVCVGNSDEKTLRSELEKTLPRAMIPANIKFVSEIKLDPRTGKGVLI